MPAWLFFRALPPLAIACAVLILRLGQPFMETFLWTVWIGFFLHAAGWLRLRSSIGADAAAYLLLLMYYSRTSDMAWSGLYPSDQITTASVAYILYAAATAMIWFDRPADSSEKQDG